MVRFYILNMRGRILGSSRHHKQMKRNPTDVRMWFWGSMAILVLKIIFL